MFRPAARFLIAPRPPDRFAARFLAAVILPPLLFFAILNLLFDLLSPYPSALDSQVVAGRAGKFSRTPAGSKIPAKSHIQLHSAEQVQNQQDDQNQPDNPYASACPPSPISVITSTAAKQEQQHNNQQDQSHGKPLSVAYSVATRCAGLSSRHSHKRFSITVLFYTGRSSFDLSLSATANEKNDLLCYCALHLGNPSSMRIFRHLRDLSTQSLNDALRQKPLGF